MQTAALTGASAPRRRTEPVWPSSASGPGGPAEDLGADLHRSQWEQRRRAFKYSGRCDGIFSSLFRAQNCPLLAQTGVAASVEDALVLVEDELDDLVLEDHEHGDVGRLRLRPEQRGAEDDGHVLHSHAIVVAVVNQPVRERGRNT